MKYYLIYFKSQFFAYADNKEIVNKFLRIHKEKFDVIPIKQKKIPKDLLDYRYEGHQLIYYTGYRTTDECPLREFELEMFENEIRDAAIQAKSDMLDIMDHMKYIQFTDSEKKIIKYTFHRVIDLLEDITESDHEVIYDEIIDILKFMKYYQQM